MAALNLCIFGKIWLSVHQPVLKFWLSVAIAWRTFNGFSTNFEMKYENSENMKADRVNKVVVSFRAFFETPGILVKI